MSVQTEPVVEPAGAPATSEIIRSGADGRLRVSPELRAELLAAYDCSGMSAMAFARQHGLKYPTFMAWLSKRRCGTPVDAVDLSGGFAEVVSSEHPAASLRVQLPGGVVLEIGSRAALPLAAELLTLLRVRC